MRTNCENDLFFIALTNKEEDEDNETYHMVSDMYYCGKMTIWGSFYKFPDVRCTKVTMSVCAWVVDNKSLFCIQTIIRILWLPRFHFVGLFGHQPSLTSPPEASAFYAAGKQ